MSEVTQEQVDELVAKPRNQWTAADRVLLSKARKAGFKVELPDKEPPKPKEQAPVPDGAPSPEEEMVALLDKPKADWSAEEKARFAELAKMGVKVKKAEAAPEKAPAETAAPPSDDPQAQARYLEQKPKADWTAADRVLLSKLRKQDVAVNLPEEAPKAAPKEAPPKKEAPPPKKVEPEVMGPYLQTLYRMRVGSEDIVPEKIEEFKAKAEKTLKDVVEAMGKEDFTLEELGKKDITLRQRYERAMLVFEGLAKLEESDPPEGALGGLLSHWKEKKKSLLGGAP
jgi:hypothetical protein